MQVVVRLCNIPPDTPVHLKFHCKWRIKPTRSDAHDLPNFPIIKYYLLKLLAELLLRIMFLRSLFLLFLTFCMVCGCSKVRRPTVVFTIFVKSKSPSWRCSPLGAVTATAPLTHYHQCRPFADFPPTSCIDVTTKVHDGVGGIVLGNWEELTIYEKTNCGGHSVTIKNTRNCIHHGEFDCFRGLFRSVGGPESRHHLNESERLLKEIDNCVPEEKYVQLYGFDNTEGQVWHEGTYNVTLEAVVIDKDPSTSQNTAGSSYESGSETNNTVGDTENVVLNVAGHQMKELMSRSIIARLHRRIGLHFGSSFFTGSYWDGNTNKPYFINDGPSHVWVPPGIRTVIRQSVYTCGKYMLKMNKLARFDYDRNGHGPTHFTFATTTTKPKQHDEQVTRLDVPRTALKIPNQQVAHKNMTLSMINGREMVPIKRRG